MTQRIFVFGSNLGGIGPIRNSKMLLDGKPTLVVAFAGRRGTADMVQKARAAGVEVIEVPR